MSVEDFRALQPHERGGERGEAARARAQRMGGDSFEQEGVRRRRRGGRGARDQRSRGQGVPMLSVIITPAVPATRAA